MEDFTTSNPDDLGWFEKDKTATINTNPDLDLTRITWITTTSLLIFTVGMLGNVTTIYIFTRSKKVRQTKVFELLLAAFDVYALTFYLISADFFVYHEKLNGEFVVVSMFCFHGYYTTILCSTVCRYVAVFHPFKYNEFIRKWRPRLVGAIAGVVCTALIYSSIALFHFDQFETFHMVVLLSFYSYFVASCLAIGILFFKISKKLASTNSVAVERHSVATVTVNNVTVGEVHRKSHMVAVKSFIAIFLCFLVSYIPGYGVVLGSRDQ